MYKRQAQHDAEHGQQQKDLPARILAPAQLESVLDAAQTVKDDEQAEHDGQHPYHHIAADDEECAQRQTDQPRDESELALEHAALYDKIPHQLHCRAGQHHAAQRIACLLYTSAS